MVVALALSVVAGAATTVGIYAARFKRPWVDAGRAEFAGFAGGVLVALCVLRLMPESVHTSRYAPLGAFAGYSLLLLVSRAVAGVEAGSEAKRRTLVPLLGIGLHSLLDGVTLSVACRADPIVGVMVAIGLILHELPEGILTYGLLRYAGIADRRAVTLALLFAALTTPLGTAISYPFVDVLASTTLGLLLSVSAGMLLFVGATHLIPEAVRASGWRATTAAGAGAFVILAVTLVEG